MLKKVLFIGIMGFLFVSSSFAGDLAGFIVSVDPSVVKKGEPMDFTINAVDSDGKVLTDYQGYILIVVKDGEKLLDSDDYSTPNDGTYAFTEQNMGTKVFTKGLVINKKGCFKVHVEDLDTSKSGDAYIGVGQKCNSNLLNSTKKIKSISDNKFFKELNQLKINNKEEIKVENINITTKEYNEIDKLIDEGKLENAIKKLINIYSKNKSRKYLYSLFSNLLNNFYDEIDRASILLDIESFIKHNNYLLTNNNYLLTNSEKKLLNKLTIKIENLPGVYNINNYLNKNKGKITLLPKYKKLLTKLGLGNVVQKIDIFTKNFFNKYKTQGIIDYKLSKLFTKIELAKYKIKNSKLNRKKKILINGVLSYLKISLIKGYYENKKDINKDTNKIGFINQYTTSIGILSSEDKYSLPDYFKNKLTEQETKKVNEDMITFQKYVAQDLKQNIEKYNKGYLSKLKNQLSINNKKTGNLTSTLDFISSKLGKISSKLNISNYSIARLGTKAKMNGNVDFNIKGGLKNPFGGETTNIDMSVSALLDSITLPDNIYLNVKNLKYTGLEASPLASFKSILDKIKKVNTKYIKFTIKNNNSSYDIFKNYDVNILYNEIDNVASHKLFVPYKKDGNKYYIYPTKYTCDYLKMLNSMNDYGFKTALYSYNLNTCTKFEYHSMLINLKDEGNIYFEKDYNSYKIGFESNKNKAKIKSYIIFNKNYSDISLDNIYLNIYEDENNKLNLSYQRGKSLHYKFLAKDLSMSADVIFNNKNLPTFINANINGSGIDGKLNLQNHQISGYFKFNDNSSSYEEIIKLVNINGQTTYDNKLSNLNIDFSGKTKYDEESIVYNYGNNAYSGYVKYAKNNMEISYNENDNYGNVLFSLKLNNGKYNGKINLCEDTNSCLNLTYNGEYRKDYFSLNTNIKSNGFNLLFYKKYNININLFSTKNNSSIKINGKLGDDDSIKFNLNNNFNTYLNNNIQDIKAPSNYIDIFNLNTSTPNYALIKKSNLSTISTALEMYFNDYGEYPGKNFGLHKIKFLEKYLVPTYIYKLPNDPIEGKNYYYMALPRKGSSNAGSVVIAEMEGRRNGNISANSIEDLAKTFKTLGDASIIEKKLGKCNETDKKCFYVMSN